MQEDALISQRLVYDYLLKSEKEVWEFPITPELRKSCKLAHQKKRLDDQKKKKPELKLKKTNKENI